MGQGHDRQGVQVTGRGYGSGGPVRVQRNKVEYNISRAQLAAFGECLCRGEIFVIDAMNSTSEKE